MKMWTRWGPWRSSGNSSGSGSRDVLPLPAAVWEWDTRSALQQWRQAVDGVLGQQLSHIMLDTLLSLKDGGWAVAVSST